MLSRVADNLYWMSRYLERAEHTARLADVHYTLTLDLSPAGAARRWRRLRDALGSEDPLPGVDDPRALIVSLALSTENPNSIRGCIASSRENARQVREQISTEMWEQLNILYHVVTGSTVEGLWHGEPHAFFRTVREGSHLFQGITDSTMSHDEGWHFIQIGRALERALSTTRLLASHLRLFGELEGEAGAAGYLEWVALLKCCTAFEAYCRTYSAEMVPRRMVAFLLLDDAFPHSLHFVVDQLALALDRVAERGGPGGSARLDRIAGRLQSQLRYAQIDEIAEQGLYPFLTHIEEQCEEIHAAIYERYIYYPVDAYLAP